MADETIPTGIKLDTSDVEKGVQRLEDLASAADKASDSIDDVGKSAKNTGKTIEGIGGTSAKGMQDLARNGKEASDAIKEQSKAIKDSILTMKSMDSVIDNLNDSEVKYLAKLADEVAQLGKNRSERAQYIAQSRQMSQGAQEIARELGGQIDAFKANAANAERAASGMSLLKTAAAGFLAVISVQKIIQLGKAYLETADAITNLNTQLKLATGSTQAAEQAYQGLFQVAQNARVGFTELGDTYAKIARSTKDLGTSQTEVLRVTETLAKAVTLSGVSAQSAKAAMIQLGQGMASGVLRGEELNSVMEQTPRVAKALADGLGVSIGQLRAMGAAGEITGEQVVKALIKASDAVDQEFGQTVITVGQATTVLQNSVDDLVGKLDKLFASSSKVAQSMLAMATAMEKTAGIVDRMNAQDLPKIFLQNQGSIQNPLDASPLFRITNYLVARAIPGSAESNAANSAALKKYDEELQQLVQDFVDADNKLSVAAKRADDALNAFASNKGNLSKSQQKLAEQNKLMTEFANVASKFSTDSQQYLKAYDALQQGLANIDAKYKDKGSGANPAKAAYDSLIQSIKAKIAAQQAEALEGQKLTPIQRRELDQRNELAAIVAKYGPLLASVVEAYQKEEIALLESNKARADAVKTEEDRLNAISKAATLEANQLAAQTKANETLAQQITKQREANEEIGLTKTAIQGLTLKRLDDNIAAKESILIAAQSNSIGDESRQHIQQLADELDLLRQKREAVAQGYSANNVQDAIQESRKAATKAAEEWKKASDDISRSLTDALLRGFEAGKGFAENLVDTIRNLFKTLVLRPIVQAVVQPIAGGITSALGVPGSNVLSSAGSASSLLGISGSSSSSALSSLGSFGAGLTSPTASFAGAAGLWANGSYGASIGMGLAAAAPWIAGAIAVYAIADYFSKRGGPKVGGQSIVDLVNGQVTTSALQTAAAPDGGRLLYTPSISDADASKLTTTVSESILNTIRSLGGTTGNLTFGLGFDTDPRGTAGSRVSSFLTAGGAEIYRQSNLDVGRDPAELQKALADELVRLTVAGIQASGFTGKIAAIFEKIDINTAPIEELNQALADATAFKQLSEVFRLLGVDAENLLDTVIEASGGFARLAQVSSDYYDVTRTDAEKAADAMSLVSDQFRQLGIAIPDSVSSYRTLIEDLQRLPLAADESADARQQLIVDLMALARPFANAVNMVNALGSSASNLAESLRQSMQTLQNLSQGFAGVFANPAQGLAYAASDYAGRFASVGYALPTSRDEINAIIEQVVAWESANPAYAAQATNIGTLKALITEYAGFYDSTIASAAPDATNANTNATQDLTQTIRASIAQMEEQASILRNQIRAIQSFIENVTKLRQSLLVGPLSPLSPADQYASALANFQSLSTLAGTGDQFAMENLPTAAQDLLQASRAMYASSESYAKDFAYVIDTLDSLESLSSALESSKTSTLGSLESAITAQQAQLDNLSTINSGVASAGLTLTQILEALKSGAANISPLYNAPTGPNADLVTSWYNQYVGRPPDLQGLQYWTGELNSGRDQATVLSEFKQSAETVAPGILASVDSPTKITESAATTDLAGIVSQWYQTYLLHAPDAGGLDYWVSEIKRLSSVESLAEAIADVFKMFKDSAVINGETLVGYASGGAAPQGWALIGEQGPELVRIPAGGAHVYNNTQTESMMASREATDEEIRLLRQQNKLLESMVGSLRRMQDKSSLVEAK